MLKILDQVKAVVQPVLITTKVVTVNPVTPGTAVPVNVRLAVANISTPVQYLRARIFPVVQALLAATSTQLVAVTPVTPGTAVPVSASLIARIVQLRMLAARVVLSTLPAREAVIPVQHQMVIDIGSPVVATVLIPGATVSALAPALTSTPVPRMHQHPVVQALLAATSIQFVTVTQATTGRV